MLEAYTRLALNFYYYLLFDEALAITGAAQTMKKVKKQKDINLSQAEFLKILIDDFQRLRKKIKNKNVIGTHQLTKSQWSSLNPAKTVYWKNFLKKAELQNQIVLTLRYLLHVPAEDISKALGVPRGTVLYRIGRGLEMLSIK